MSVLLGPGVNIKRSPLCGRNFEYFSEDPFLSGRLGAAWVRGVQSRGIGTSLKHYAANNQETDRLRVSADVDERTLREIYLPAFEHIVTTEQPATVMCAYNKLNGTHASEHHGLLTTILRDEWGFAGLVVSDWGAVSDRVTALAAGTDLEMPPTNTDDEIVAAVRSGDLDEATLDAANQRLLDLIERTVAARQVEPPTFDRTEHHALAREAATAAAVLLKNDGDILPLDADTTIAVIGEFARTPRYQGAGSSQVVPTQLDTALDAIIVAGCGTGSGSPLASRSTTPTRTGSCSEAVAVASPSDVAVVVLGLPGPAESEGFDRTDIDLPAEQLAMLDAVLAANPHRRRAVERRCGAALSAGRPRTAIVEAGCSARPAGARSPTCFRRGQPVRPTGRDHPAAARGHPGVPELPGRGTATCATARACSSATATTTAASAVAFPFGHGLSYTTFEYSGVEVARCGAEVRDWG